MRVVILFASLAVSVMAQAAPVNYEAVKALIQERLGFSTVRVEITGRVPSNKESIKTCSLVLNTENGQFSLYEDGQDDDVTFKALGRAGVSLVDRVADGETGLILHASKVAPGIGQADFEFKLSPEKLASIQTRAKVGGLFPGLKKKSERRCLLTGEPRTVPTWKSIWRKLRG